MRLQSGQSVETMALVSQEDEAKLGTKIGDAGSQAIWEAYMMLRCLWVWLDQDGWGYRLSVLLRREPQCHLC